ncbi:ATP-binding cassette domain-containing protein, partial [Hominimerdicola sp. 21CYCFAH17_S]
KLSGGQKQRVAIARAIVNEPSMILADEPTGALDSKTSKEIMELFKSLNEQGRTVIIVTHDPKIAEQCDRIIEILDGEIISGSRSSKLF